jgi:inosine-uridine nucleoside N-ribohydrolase
MLIEGDEPMPSLIIDTDPGVDDAFAIALACAMPEVRLLGVTAVFGNVPLTLTSRNARRLLALLSREDVPVGIGAARPLVHPHAHEAFDVHGSDGLSGYADTLPEPANQASDVDAVTLMARLLDAADEPVTIVAIGPLTNVALLLAAHPRLVDKIDRLVVMGGGLAHGNTSPAAEFNLWSDPEAAHRVLAGEQVPVTLVPLDLTLRCTVDRAWLTALAASGPVGTALAGFTDDTFAYYAQFLGRDGVPIHDALAVAEAALPGLLRTTALPVEVDCTFGPGRGGLIADQRPKGRREQQPTGRRPVDIALDPADGVDALRKLLLTRLSSL